MSTILLVFFIGTIIAILMILIALFVAGFAFYLPAEVIMAWADPKTPWWKKITITLIFIVILGIMGIVVLN